MKNYLVVTAEMVLDEQKKRNIFNMVFDKMREQKRFTENEVKNFFLRQTDFNTCCGVYLKYDEALGYYNEMLNN